MGIIPEIGGLLLLIIYVCSDFFLLFIIALQYKNFKTFYRIKRNFFTR